MKWQIAVFPNSWQHYSDDAFLRQIISGIEGNIDGWHDIHTGTKTHFLFGLLTLVSDTVGSKDTNRKTRRKTNEIYLLCFLQLWRKLFSGHSSYLQYPLLNALWFGAWSDFLPLPFWFIIISSTFGAAAIRPVMEIWCCLFVFYILVSIIWKRLHPFSVVTTECVYSFVLFLRLG